MAVANSGNIIFVRSSIISNPTNLTLGAPPYGGTYLGQTRGFRFLTRPRYRDVWAEEIGAVSDSFYVGEGPCEIRTVLRYPDDDMLAAATPFSILGTHRHWLFRPGGTTNNLRAGTSMYGTGIKLLIAPKADANMPAIIMYNAIPEIAEDAELRYWITEEYGLSLRFIGTPDSSGRVYDTGYMADLSL